MFSIYKYTLTKYLKAQSTWIIIVASMFIGGFIGGYLPFSIFPIHHKNAETLYILLSGIVIAAVTSILSIFSSIFAGFKAATMFKDEVEDGTFLVILSKPLKRSRIVFGKWLALQTIILLYSFLSILAFCVSVTIFDIGHKISGLDNFGVVQLRHKILYISAYMWGITALVGLIFSSIGLLLSTKLTVGATIGISIGIGVIIPITSLFSTFTQKNEYHSITTAKMFTISDAFKAGLNMAKKMGVDAPQGLYNDLDELEDTINNPHFIARMGIATGNTNAFKMMWPFDINFQINKLSEFASQQSIPNYAMELAGEISGDSLPAVGNRIVSTIDKTHPLSKEYLSTQYKDAQKNDYNVIIRQMKQVMPLMHRVGEKVIGFAWNIAKKQIEIQHNKLLQEAARNPLTKSINIDVLIKMIGAAIKIDINDSDKNLFKPEVIKQRFPAAGHVVGSVPSWQEPWYKMSQELEDSHNAHISLLTAYNCLEQTFDPSTYAQDHRTFNSIIGRPNSKEQISTLAAFGLISNQIPHTLKHMSKQAVDQANVLIKNAWDVDTSPTKGPLMQLSEDEPKHVADFMENAGHRIYEMLNPLDTFLFNQKNLDEEIKKHKINIAHLETSEQAIMGIDKTDTDPDAPKARLEWNQENTKLLTLNNVNLLPNDLQILQRAVSLAYDRPDLLVKLSAQKYIKKLNLFWIYLGLALFLVPLSYLIVRRQDFR